MTFMDKGQVFMLHDEGKTLDEISKETNYSPTRLLCLIDGIKGTNAWTEAKDAYTEARYYELDDKRPRTTKSTQRVADYHGEVRGKVYDKSTTHRGIGSDRDQSVTYRRAKKQVSRVNTRPYRPKHEPRDWGVPSGGQSGRPNVDSIIDGMRKSKDYKGE